MAILIGWAAAVLPCAALAAAETKMLDYMVEGDAVPKPLGGLRGDAARGRAIALDRSKGNCLICHAVASVEEPFQGKIGPSLTGVAKRLNLGQIRLRMIDQSRINPKTLMPPYYRVKELVDVAPEYSDRPALDAQAIEDVVAWLSTLKD